MTTTTFEVRKDQLATTRVQTMADAPLAGGQVRVRIAHFALTANNITYAAFGDAMNYWQFFPLPADADGTAWGCIPVWGFGDVLQSLHPGVAVGERLYGYWPMASHALLQPVRLSPAHFSDGAPHRAALHAVYNQYQRCSADPFYSPDSEAQQALLRPLFLTAWLIDDFLADNAFFGAAGAGQRGVMLLSSASSKTAYATAAQLAKRPEVEVVGLTSPGNLAFCESLGVYSRVLTYDQLDTLAPELPCVYVDFAGNGALRRAIHTRFARLAYSCSIGGTHVGQLGGAKDLPGPRATLFFAPAQVKKRSADWGAAEFNHRLVAAWHAFREQASDPVAPWLVVQTHRGADAVSAAYATVLGGQGDPRLGHMLSFDEGGRVARARLRGPAEAPMLGSSFEEGSVDVSALADPDWDKPIPGAHFVWEGVSYPVLQAKEDKKKTLNNERIPERAKPWRGTNLLHTKGVRVVPHSIVWLAPRTFVRIPD